MKFLSLIFIFIAIFQISHAFQKILTQSTIKIDQFKWPYSLAINYQSVSEEEPCKTEACRSDDTINNIAFCKIISLSQIIDQKFELVYMTTPFKAHALGECTKHLFQLSKKPKSARPPPTTPKVAKTPKAPSDKPKVKSVSLIRVCVPIDATKDAWIDADCPNDDCPSERPTTKQPCGNPPSPEQIAEAYAEGSDPNKVDDSRLERNIPSPDEAAAGNDQLSQKAQKIKF